MEKDCQLLRERIHEILVEPHTAPIELHNKWERHRKICQKCDAYFVQAQQQQQVADQLVGDLISQLDEQRKPLFFWRKRNVFLLAIAACFLLLLSLLFLNQHKIYSRNNERAMIVTELKKQQQQNGMKIEEHKVYKLAQEIFTHLQVAGQCIDNLRNLAYTCQRQQQSIPLLRIRLMLHCRLLMVNPDNLLVLKSLAHNGYDRQGVELLFAQALKNIGTTAQKKKALIVFFKQACPHILAIMKSRNNLLAKFGIIEKQALGGESQILTMLHRLEFVKHF